MLQLVDPVQNLGWLPSLELVARLRAVLVDGVLVVMGWESKVADVLVYLSKGDGVVLLRDLEEVLENRELLVVLLRVVLHHLLLLLY